MKKSCYDINKSPACWLILSDWISASTQHVFVLLGYICPGSAKSSVLVRTVSVLYKTGSVAVLAQAVLGGCSNQHFMFAPFVMADLMQAVATVGPLIKSLVDQSKQSTDGNEQTTLDAVIKMALESNLAYTQRVFFKNAAVHPDNRHKTGKNGKIHRTS